MRTFVYDPSDEPIHQVIAALRSSGAIVIPLGQGCPKVDRETIPIFSHPYGEKNSQMSIPPRIDKIGPYNNHDGIPLPDWVGPLATQEGLELPGVPLELFVLCYDARPIERLLADAILRGCKESPIPSPVVA